MSKAVFTRGSTLRHVIVMTSASTIGLVAMFTVDLVDMYFLSLLGEQELAAAVGFGGTLPKCRPEPAPKDASGM